MPRGPPASPLSSSPPRRSCPLLAQARAPRAAAAQAAPRPPAPAAAATYPCGRQARLWVRTPPPRPHFWKPLSASRRAPRHRPASTPGPPSLPPRGAPAPASLPACQVERAAEDRRRGAAPSFRRPPPAAAAAPARLPPPEQASSSLRLAKTLRRGLSCATTCNPDTCRRRRPQSARRPQNTHLPKQPSPPYRAPGRRLPCRGQASRVLPGGSEAPVPPRHKPRSAAPPCAKRPLHTHQRRPPRGRARDAKQTAPLSLRPVPAGRSMPAPPP
jgi:hypothetical protein